MEDLITVCKERDRRKGNQPALYMNGSYGFYVDDLLTLFKQIRGDTAKIQIVREDLTTEDGWLCRGGGFFAHGATLREASNSLTAKLLQDKPLEERIDAFKSEFDLGEKYPASEFFEWHFTLTGSCSFGRKQWVKSKGIDLESDKFTPEEFIGMVAGEYGSDAIEKLKEAYGLNNQ